MSLKKKHQEFLIIHRTVKNLLFLINKELCNFKVVFQNILFWFYLVVFLAIYIHIHVFPLHWMKVFQHISCILHNFLPVQTYLTFQIRLTESVTLWLKKVGWKGIMGEAKHFLGERPPRTPWRWYQ